MEYNCLGEGNSGSWTLQNNFKTANVEQLKLKVDGLAKTEIIAEQPLNIKKLANSNFSEAAERALC